MTAVEPAREPAAPIKIEPLHPPVGRSAPNRPISIYEVHLPSWMRVPEQQNRSLTPSEMAPKLAEHLKFLNFTHAQFHLTGQHNAQDLKVLSDYLHEQNFGVILETNEPAYRATDPAEASADGRCIYGETALPGQHYKWDLGWAEQTLAYFSTDPLYRKFRQSQFSHRNLYAFDASYILPLSHLLVTRPRQSLFTLMPGDEWQKFANLRLLFAYTFLLPGKKLVFMGSEFGQKNPWLPETSLDWHLVNETNPHGQLMQWVANLAGFYRNEPALHLTDTQSAGFQWIDTTDAASSVISFLRKSSASNEVLLAVFNFTPVPRHNYRVGVPRGGIWGEALNSDAREFGGSGQGNFGEIEAAPFGWNFQSHSLMLTLPPLAAVVLKAPLAA